MWWYICTLAAVSKTKCQSKCWIRQDNVINYISLFWQICCIQTYLYTNQFWDWPLKKKISGQDLPYIIPIENSLTVFELRMSYTAVLHVVDVTRSSGSVNKLVFCSSEHVLLLLLLTRHNRHKSTHKQLHVTNEHDVIVLRNFACTSIVFIAR